MTHDTQTIAVISRAAAHRLSSAFGPALLAEVEVALNSQELEQRPDQYFDPISVGGLIVATATLAWTIYTGLTRKAPRNDIERRVRVTLRDTGTLTDKQHDLMLEVVVSEVIKAVDPEY